MPHALKLVALAGLACLGMSACAPLSASVDLQTVPAQQQSRASVMAVPSGPGKVAPSERVVVTARDGQLASVSVVGPHGKQLTGSFSPDGATWTADASALDYAATYSVAATAVDSRGVPVTTRESFTTARPDKVFSAWVSPAQGSVVGVGMPISVGFDRDISAEDRAAVEKALVVRTSAPLVGAWSWTGPREVRFRPVTYWPADSQVQVQADLTGVQLADGAMGSGNSTTSFAVGPSMVTKVDAVTHQASVYRDGTLIKTIPVTTGKPGFETRSGTVVITTKEPVRVMDAATGGTDTTDPEYYRIEVHWAMRITSTGEFLHAAPWSVYAQGKRNVSHGCVGMSTDNAQWLFERSNIGDVVEISGTPVQQNLGNGVTVWMNTWDEWLADSKVGPVTTQAVNGAIAPVTIPVPTA
jgi:lipoprotein-anchoring transpeptidase ErfK/SrfK